MRPPAFKLRTRMSGSEEAAAGEKRRWAAGCRGRVALRAGERAVECVPRGREQHLCPAGCLRGSRKLLQWAGLTQFACLHRRVWRQRAAPTPAHRPARCQHAAAAQRKAEGGAGRMQSGGQAATRCMRHRQREQQQQQQQMWGLERRNTAAGCRQLQHTHLHHAAVQQLRVIPPHIGHRLWG